MSNNPPPQPENATVITIPSHSRRRRYISFPNFEGAKPIPLGISLAIGLLVAFAIPKPHEVSKQAWRLFAIFLTTIAGLVLGPLPVGAWAFVCLTISVVTKTLPFKDAFAAFTNEVIWLIVASFFFSRGFVKTGLGDRLAMYFVRWLGKSTLGLAYGLAISEAIISPAMPSTTARAGGIFLPIINSLAIAGESRPKDGSARKLGAFLIQSQFQSSSSSSALFMTAAAQNMLCIKLAESLGVKIKSPWITWFKAACVPALVSLMLTPYIVYKIFPPETKRTPDAPILATTKLEEMGPVKRNEWIMMGTMLVTVALWISGYVQCNRTIKHIAAEGRILFGHNPLFVLPFFKLLNTVCSQGLCLLGSLIGYWGEVQLKGISGPRTRQKDIILGRTGIVSLCVSLD